MLILYRGELSELGRGRRQLEVAGVAGEARVEHEIVEAGTAERRECALVLA